MSAHVAVGTPFQVRSGFGPYVMTCGVVVVDPIATGLPTTPRGLRPTELRGCN